MPAILSPSAKQQFFTAGSTVAAGYRLYTYAANTSTPRATFTDRAGLVPNTNPIILDARGEATIYLTPGLVYDYVLKTDQDALVWTREDVIADAGAANAVVFVQDGDGAVERTVQDELRDYVSVKQFGAEGDGATDDTQSFVDAFAAASGREVYVPDGTYMLDSALDIPANLHLRGSGKGRAVLKRSPAAPANYVVGITGVGTTISDLTVDGNLANNPTLAHNILIQGAGRFTLRDIETKGAQGLSDTYGCGVAVVNTTDAVNNTYSNLINVTSLDNDVHGLYASQASNFKIIGGDYSRNGFDGISIVNQSLPVVPTELHWSIVGATCAFNGVSGIGVSGFGDELNKPTSYANTITGCNIHHNQGYGVAYQSNSCAISGNIIANNGNSDFNGGVLLNAQRVSFAGNSVVNNTHYGIDAGGCLDCAFSGNVIQGNVGPSGGGTGLNLGASEAVTVSGNTFSSNGGSGGGENIGVRAFDGGSVAAAFRTTGGRISIVGNTIKLDNTLQHGILITKGDPNAVLVKDNFVIGGSALRAFKYECRFVASGGNVWTSDGIALSYTTPPADPLVIPDDGADIVVLTGGAGTTINNVKTVSSQAFEGKVRAVRMTNKGSGYTSAPTVTLTGGGGAGATATALIAGGEVRAIEINAQGSGYTSAPTVNISGGGGAGASGTAYVGCPNFGGRTVRIRNTVTGNTIKNGTGNVLLVSADYAPATDRGALVLEGHPLSPGNWLEVTRSG
jgi:hypothetical protein